MRYRARKRVRLTIENEHKMAYWPTIPMAFRVAVRVIILTAAAALAAAATAQSGKGVPQAFASAHAPESAVEVCHGTSGRAALDCARSKCQRKAGRGACFAVTVCEPSGWAGVMSVKLKAAHFSSVICGAPTREALTAALRAFCRGNAGLEQCSVAQLWTPDGKLMLVDHTWTPADLQN